PTNEAWIDPWLALLRNLGVRLENRHELVGFDVRHGRISSAQVRGHGGGQHVVADWYVCALPVERAKNTWNRAMVAADPQLIRAASLTTRWMNGIQFYLREPRPIVKGIMLYVDSPWGIGSVSQTQFWSARDFARDYGDGLACEDVSAFITDATTPGIVYGKTAQECTAPEIAREVWEQMKRHTNKPGRSPVLTDDLLQSWHLDPGLVRHPGRWVDEDQLWISTPGSVNTLPNAATAIPNLVLGASYVRNDFLDVDCMETANLAGRIAANTILRAVGSNETPAQIFERVLPAEWQAFRDLDDQRFRCGRPNLFDTDLTLAQLSELLGQPVHDLTATAERLVAHR
ncbi:MAG: FAD-dependent oxidoreductase, partial [Solirubrobacteraceae bacterium]